MKGALSVHYRTSVIISDYVYLYLPQSHTFLVTHF